MSATPDCTFTYPEQIIADLRRERDEALAREAAIAEVLQVINSPPGELAPVFDAIAKAAATLCDAANSGLFRFDGSLIHFAAQYGVTAAQLDALHIRSRCHQAPVASRRVPS
jgi:hypothetical protein